MSLGSYTNRNRAKLKGQEITYPYQKPKITTTWRHYLVWIFEKLQNPVGFMWKPDGAGKIIAIAKI
jgi:hypothetical protein